MERQELNDLKTGLEALAVFRGLLEDPVLEALRLYLAVPTVENYAFFVSALYRTKEGTLGGHIRDICDNNENIYVRTVGSGREVSAPVRQCAEEELKVLQAVTELDSVSLRSLLTWRGFLPDFASEKVDLAESYAYRVANIGKYGYGCYAGNRMFYLDETNAIVPVCHPDQTRFADLVDYEAERQILIDNTEALLRGRPAANILLTGDAGTGKSSTVKAIGNELFREGLRIIEIRKDQLRSIPRVLDELSENPLKFILFIDDLSFLKDDDQFNALKAVLEGSVSAKSGNVVIYATSNHRHIIKERFSDRDGDDVHRNETMQELISLSERFGIHVTFQKPDKETFLRIVRHLAERSGIALGGEELERRAERFALERGGRSARLARQFVDGLLSVSADTENGGDPAAFFEKE